MYSLKLDNTIWKSKKCEVYLCKQKLLNSNSISKLPPWLNFFSVLFIDEQLSHRSLVSNRCDDV